MQTSVFKVENICCKLFQKKLKKELSKIPGVNKVAVDSERSLVLVKGRVDPMFVTAIIAKLGKNAEILSHDRQPGNNREHVDQEYQKRVHKDCSCQDFNGHKMEENFHRFHDRVSRHGHKIDENFNRFRDHIRPEAGEHVCRDEHCKIHHSRNMYRDHMPERESTDLFGHFAQGHYRGTNFRFRDGHYPFMDDTYLQPPMMPRPMPAYGFGSGRPMPAYDDCSTSFSDENAQNCSIM
ncbi:heavy-metal-associated domain-containing family [Olea europaea subsp. europaea]|uniref:Heavy-metal-associated domain-containing family n=1 Tax=Olea europaea subsp. europaea TaxID=158383 RepID=A0A8S0V502_OLEEU|nr:heavy-metal-associated domain-containing family [Olea europaea subsp. europaea]